MDITEEELKKKTESLYKKSYWDERKSENSLNIESIVFASTSYLSNFISSLLY